MTIENLWFINLGSSAAGLASYINPQTGTNKSSSNQPCSYYSILDLKSELGKIKIERCQQYDTDIELEDSNPQSTTLPSLCRHYTNQK